MSNSTGYYCDCTWFCHQLKKVSRSTYYEHASYCEMLPAFNPSNAGPSASHREECPHKRQCTQDIKVQRCQETENVPDPLGESPGQQDWDEPVDNQSVHEHIYDQIHTGSGSVAGSASNGLDDDSNIQDVSPAPSNHFDEEVSPAPSNHFEEEDDVSYTTGSRPPLPVIEVLKTAMLFIQGLAQANLDDSDLSEDTVKRLQHLPEEELSIEDPNDLYSLQ
ncbi:hypothetical protein K439DRAFT_1612864 [Ramaria rubella]|nr:hypothetical protein K439DRAFT_1612864 [Ramaria rubella]